MELFLFIFILTLFTFTTTSVTVNTQEERILEDRITHATCCELVAEHVPILRAWNEACQHVPRSIAVEREMRNKFIALTHLNGSSQNTDSSFTKSNIISSNSSEERNYNQSKSITETSNCIEWIQNICDDSNFDKNDVSNFSHHLHESAIELYIRSSVFCSNLPHHHKELVHSAAFVTLVEAFPLEEDFIVDGMETTCKHIQQKRRNELNKWVNVIVMSFQQSQKLQSIYTSIAELQNMLCDAPCKKIVDEFGE